MIYDAQTNEQQGRQNHDAETPGCTRRECGEGACRFSEKEIARFWRGISKGNPQDCWEWKGYREGGYGRLKIASGQILSHRMSWTLHRGEIPAGLFVLHRCDNRPCGNPDHLFLGTLTENNKDRDAKGRHRPLYGEANGLAKLTMEIARNIRQEYSLGFVTQQVLADKHSVTQKAIYMIIHHQTWKESR